MPEDDKREGGVWFPNSSLARMNACDRYRDEKLARVRSRVIRIHGELVAMKGLLEHNKKGFCEMATENIQLMEENEALRLQLEAGK